MVRRNSARRGQSLVEYGILIGGVALVCLAAVSIFGHKVGDLIGTSAAALPSPHDDHAGPIVIGSLVSTTDNGSGIILDPNAVNTFTSNFGFGEGLVVEP